MDQNQSAKSRTLIKEPRLEFPILLSRKPLGIPRQLLGRIPYHPSHEEYTELVDAYGADWFKAHNMEAYADDFTLMKKMGCEKCDSSGYKGRIALHELLMGTEQAKIAIKRKYSAAEIKNQSLAEDMKSMKVDGISKVFQGITVLSQVLKVCT